MIIDCKKKDGIYSAYWVIKGVKMNMDRKSQKREFIIRFKEIVLERKQVIFGATISQTLTMVLAITNL